MKAKLCFDMTIPQDVDDFYAACLGPGYEAAIKEFRQRLEACVKSGRDLYPDQQSQAAALLEEFNQALARRGICGA